jgi:N-acyl-D-aspartate/D-glutamate deacylase
MGTGYDLLIREATLVDGSGAEPYLGDLAVTGDRIAALGDLAGASAQVVIDGRGLVLAPGFIDAHAHDDQAVFQRRTSLAKLSQGVTSVVVGNCGISLAPLRLTGAPPAPLNLLGGPEVFRYPRFQDYAAALRRAPLTLNVAALVGHGTLRVQHQADWSRPATPEELAAMAADLREAMAAGSLGLSTGLAYPTNCAAPTAEVVALARVAAEASGRLCMHIRDEYDGVAGAVREAFQCARESGAFLVLSHQKVAGRGNHGRSQELLDLYGSAGAGLGFAIDTYPYAAGSTVLDPVSVAQSARVLVTWSEPHPERNGQTLAAIARDWGCTELEAMERLQPGGAVYFHMTEADVSRFLGYHRCMLGSDGLPADHHPHPRLWGAFARMLAVYVRERGQFTLAEAVRKMTALPAEVFGLRERGRLLPGHFADLVLFDPDRVRDCATYADPELPAEGVQWVFVNGCQAWPDPGAVQGAGRFLPSGGC